MLVHFLYFKKKLPPIQKRKSIFQKSGHLSNLIWFSENCLNLPTHFISYIKQPKVEFPQNISGVSQLDWLFQ